MMQNDFQELVLQKLQEVLEGQSVMDKRLLKIEVFTEHQKEVNKRQEEVNKTLIESQDGLEKLIEHEVVERFAGMSDGTKAYTDQKVREHEASFHPRASAAQSNF